MASGDTLSTFAPRSNAAPLLNYATLASRVGHLVLEFVKAGVRNGIFEGFLPRNYAGGGITATIVWAAKTDNAGGVVWAGAFERMNDGAYNLDSESFAANQQATGTAPGTTGIVRYTTIAFTNAQIDGLLAGEAFRLRLQRLVSDGGDTMAGTAQLVRVELRET